MDPRNNIYKDNKVFQSVDQDNIYKHFQKKNNLEEKPSLPTKRNLTAGNSKKRSKFQQSRNPKEDREISQSIKEHFHDDRFLQISHKELHDREPAEIDNLIKRKKRQFAPFRENSTVKPSEHASSRKTTARRSKLQEENSPETVINKVRQSGDTWPERLVDQKDFNTDETAKILQKMVFMDPKPASELSESEDLERIITISNQHMPNRREIVIMRDSIEDPEEGQSIFEEKRQSSDKEEHKSNRKFSQSSDEFFMEAKKLDEGTILLNSERSMKMKTGLSNRQNTGKSSNPSKLMNSVQDKNADDSMSLFGVKKIESQAKIFSEDSRRNIRGSRNALEDDMGFFEKKESESGLFDPKGDQMSLSNEGMSGSHFFNKMSHRNNATNVSNLSSEKDNNLDFHQYPSGFLLQGIHKKMISTKEKKLNGGNYESIEENYYSISKKSMSIKEMPRNRREIISIRLDNYNKSGSSKLNILLDSGPNLSEANIGKDIHKACNMVLFEQSLDKKDNEGDLREAFKKSHEEILDSAAKSKKETDAQPNAFVHSFNNLQDVSESPEMNRGIREIRMGSRGESFQKKKSITTIKNYRELKSSKIYSSPEPGLKASKLSVQDDNFKHLEELPESAKVNNKAKRKSENLTNRLNLLPNESNQFQLNEALNLSKEKPKTSEKFVRKMKDDIQEQKIFIKELKTKNKTLNKMLVVEKNLATSRKNHIKKGEDQLKKKNKLLSRMGEVLEGFRERLRSNLRVHDEFVEGLAQPSFLEQQNSEFVKKAFQYEKMIALKMKEMKEMRQKFDNFKRELADRKIENANLRDKMQVHKKRSEDKDNDLKKLNAEVKNYERVVGNLEHKIEVKDMKLSRKTKKYRSEIARARKCKNCSQRSIRKSGVKKSERLLQDLKDIEEESLSDRTDSDSDRQEVNMNDYQEIVDSRNQWRGRYNELHAKYMDCFNSTNNYRIKYRMMADKNMKLRSLAKKKAQKKPF